MDPAVKAATELNAIFGRLEIPCEVCVTNAEGKHVKATADLDEGYALVEELPIVSWPSASLVALGMPFCFHCLRLSAHQRSVASPPSTAGAPSGTAGDSAAASSTSASASAPVLPEGWTRCAQCTSCFCSSACQQASARAHRLLCSCLPALRSDVSGASSTTAAAAASGISVEALARCIAWIVQRLSSVIEQQQLTHEVLQADYLQQLQQDKGTGHTVAWSATSLNYQLFSQVVAPFSRLISPPDNVHFDGVSLPSWIDTVRASLAEKCVRVLLCAGGAPLGKLKLQQPLPLDSSASGSSSSSSFLWAEALVQVLFSTDTLRTLVGQMVLNAHGVNDYVLPAKTAPSPAAFEWILKGAGLYALLASFNHSCCPNAAVSNVDETHEIVLKTTRPVKAGEPLTITYIPLGETATVAERRQQLKNYFFTCHCSRCAAEEKVC